VPTEDTYGAYAGPPTLGAATPGSPEGLGITRPGLDPLDDEAGGFEGPDLEVDPGFNPWNPMRIGSIELYNGEQLVKKKAYYHFRSEGSDGFLNTAGFEMIEKNSIFSVGGVDMGGTNARKTYDPLPSDADGATSWIYGEEPIVYQGAVLDSERSTEDSDWQGMKTFIRSTYQALPFTSFHETEHYLNWYNYSSADLNFGFNWKNEKAEWYQSNQLRAFNKEENPMTGETNSSTQYNFHAEAPYLDNWSDNSLYTDDITMPITLGTGVESRAEVSGFQNSMNTILPIWYTRSMKIRFKTPRLVANTVERYLDEMATYVANTGYTTVLKRALSSETQIVRRFTNREFTAMQTSTITTAEAADSEASSPYGPVPLPEGSAPADPMPTFAPLPAPMPMDSTTTGDY
jgi:hypothetical protein